MNSNGMIDRPDWLWNQVISGEGLRPLGRGCADLDATIDRQYREHRD